VANRRAKNVAQIFNLLYRRVALGKPRPTQKTWDRHDAPQITNLRYSRVQLCATNFDTRLDSEVHIQFAISCSRLFDGYSLKKLQAAFSAVKFLSYFTEMLFACRIIHSSFAGRPSAP
jgi:hypothetical protein